MREVFLDGIGMSKGRRKGKREVNKRRKLATIAPPSESPSPLGAAKLRPEQAVFASKEILIAAPAELCFDTLAKQLEQPCQWDPILYNAQPVSDVRGQIGATSQVILNLGGKEVKSQAMISRYRPNRAISWVISSKPKVREDWQLERKLRGTQARVTLAHELGGWVIGRLIYKVMRRKRVDQDLDKMLIELKKAVESISPSQQRVTGGVES